MTQALSTTTPAGALAAPAASQSGGGGAALQLPSGTPPFPGSQPPLSAPQPATRLPVEVRAAALRAAGPTTLSLDEGFGEDADEYGNGDDDGPADGGRGGGGGGGGRSGGNGAGGGGGGGGLGGAQPAARRAPGRNGNGVPVSSFGQATVRGGPWGNLGGGGGAATPPASSPRVAPAQPAHPPPPPPSAALGGAGAPLIMNSVVAAQPLLMQQQRRSPAAGRGSVGGNVAGVSVPLPPGYDAGEGWGYQTAGRAANGVSPDILGTGTTTAAAPGARGGPVFGSLVGVGARGGGGGGGGAGDGEEGQSTALDFLDEAIERNWGLWELKNRRGLKP